MIEQFIAWLEDKETNAVAFGTAAETKQERMRQLGREVTFYASREFVAERFARQLQETDARIIELLCQSQQVLVYMGGRDFMQGAKDAMQEIHNWHVAHGI